MSLEIAIVDDDKIIIFLHKIMMEKSGLSSNPLCYLSAKDLLNEMRSNPDSQKKYLIFLDINMPEKNGWEFLDAVSASSFANQVYVVIVTSSIDSADREMAMKYKCVIDYYEKPIDTSSCNRIKFIPDIAPYFQSLN